MTVVRRVLGDLSSTGRLGAVDGAMRAASLGGSILGVCCENDMVVVATASNSPLTSSSCAYPSERTWLVDEHILVSAVGLGSDARMVADFAFEECSKHRHAFGTAPSARRIAAKISDVMATAARQSRPLGIHVVVAGPPSLLCHIDPSGRLRNMRALAAGKYSEPLAKQLAALIASEDVIDGSALLREVWRDTRREDGQEEDEVEALDVSVLRR